MDIKKPSSPEVPVKSFQDQAKDSEIPEADNNFMGLPVRKRPASEVELLIGKRFRQILPAGQSVPTANAGSCSSVEEELTDAQKKQQERKARNRVSSQKFRDKKRNELDSLKKELECARAELVKADIDKEILRVELTSNEIEINRLKAEILQRDKTIASLREVANKNIPPSFPPSRE
ncbi:hypothetical protein NX722_03365 [Endozoicomonas gorgoniicola]|uniref:BZIP domain-containing protein n=1 Tax=Endozoicomonas gorgoniicola TaxID=1234144 RepID=A0ABT3MQR6_9GAMM|nr:bZIP transcription factor [Endozoicomonas gorgoniicola]MCW7551697.1 hypothetical protein [Endozoicomonas gorgoniicola]